jgi:hypothetical protein
MYNTLLFFNGEKGGVRNAGKKSKEKSGKKSKESR